MNSLIYIITHSAKNGLIELFRKPAKLIMYLLVILLLVFVFILPSFTGRATGGDYQDIFWLKGAFFLFIVLFSVISIRTGLTSGGSIFDMDDVNLLFVSPLNPRAILMYGLARLTKIAFLSGFFILFQNNTLNMVFGIKIAGVFILFFIFMLSMIMLSVLSIFIYSVTNGNPGRKKAVCAICILFIVPLVVYAAVSFINTGDAAEALEASINSPFFTWIPAAGWASECAAAFISGDTASGLLPLALIILAIAGVTVIIAISKSDYYEDVLAATETAYEKKRAAKEGNVNAASFLSGRTVSVTRTGIGGFGAMSVFYKHLRESFRESRFGFLNITSVFFILGAAVMAILLPGESGCMTILVTLMWVQIFFIGMGRGLKELSLHYIYLIPEPSFKKIIWSNMEPVFKTVIESALIFGISGSILDSGIFMILGAIVTYSLFSFMLIGLNYLSMRLTGANLSSGILVLLYIIAVIVVMLPGVLAAFKIGFAAPEGWTTLAGLGVLSVWELILALVFFAFSKGALHRCDMLIARPGTTRTHF